MNFFLNGFFTRPCLALPCRTVVGKPCPITDSSQPLRAILPVEGPPALQLECPSGPVAANRRTIQIINLLPEGSMKTGSDRYAKPMRRSGQAVGFSAQILSQPPLFSVINIQIHALNLCLCSKPAKNNTGLHFNNSPLPLLALGKQIIILINTMGINRSHF